MQFTKSLKNRINLKQTSLLYKK